MSVSCLVLLLQHFTSQREDFEGTREGILVWLTEMDLQLTNVEHFSVSDIEDKMRQLNVSLSVTAVNLLLINVSLQYLISKNLIF